MIIGFICDTLRRPYPLSTIATQNIYSRVTTIAGSTLTQAGQLFYVWKHISHLSYLRIIHTIIMQITAFTMMFVCGWYQDKC